MQNNRNFRITEYISNNFDKDINIHSLAEHIHLSSSYISHYFKDTFKVSFNQYLTTFRILNAKYLLSATNLPITEIAFQCGFDSSTDFSRVFKKKNLRELRRPHIVNSGSTIPFSVQMTVEMFIRPAVVFMLHFLRSSM